MITVHIERVVLEGFALGPAERRLLKAAVEAELGLLLSQGAISEALATGAALPSVGAGDVGGGDAGTQPLLGQQIAKAIYGGIGT
jgi:hypothetical protein